MMRLAGLFIWTLALSFAVAPATAQPMAEGMPPLVSFEPVLGVEQTYRVDYLMQSVEAGQSVDIAGIRYRLVVLPLQRDGEGYRYRFSIDNAVLTTPEGHGINMVVAAALITAGDQFEMSVSDRGYADKVEDFRAVRQRLQDAADALDDPVTRSIARSVVDNHDAEQLSSRIQPAFDLMGFILSYVYAAEATPGPTMSWFGFGFDVTRVRDPATGGLQFAFTSHGRLNGGPTAPSDVEGRATILANGQIVSFTHVQRRGAEGVHTRYLTEVELLPAAR